MFKDFAGVYLPSERVEPLPVQDRRGIDYMDSGHRIILTEGSYERLLTVLEQEIPVNSIEKDAYGKTVRSSENIIFVFSFVGHPWNIIVAPTNQRNFLVLDYYLARKLSNSISETVIYFAVASGYVGYESMSNKKLSEVFLYQEIDLDDEDEIDDEYADDYEPLNKNHSLVDYNLKAIRRKDGITEENFTVLNELGGKIHLYPSNLIDDFAVMKFSNTAKRVTGFDAARALLSRFNVYIPAISWNIFPENQAFPVSIEGLKKDDFSYFSCVVTSQTFLHNEDE